MGTAGLGFRQTGSLRGLVSMGTDHPSPEEVLYVRIAAGLTQKEAGAEVKSARRTWQDWERGRRKMPGGLFDLFKLKRGLE